MASVGIGFFGGSCLGLAFAFVRLRSDRTLQNPGDSPGHLQLRELGVIPKARNASLVSFLPRRSPKRPPPLPVTLTGGLPSPARAALPPASETVPLIKRNASNSIALATWLRNPPEMAEAFCGAMNSLLFASAEESQVIVLTSPGPGDGKTTAATNLAAALAKIGRRVVLVDGDLRKPRLSSIFNLECTGGLGKLLNDRELLEDDMLSNYVHKTEVDNLFVFPTAPAGNDVSAKLHSARMQSVLQWLRREYDFVIIDSPPMLHISDARVLGWLADGVLLVFRSRKTTREEAQAAVECLTQDGINVLGTILNDWNPRKSPGYGSYATYMRAGQ